MKKRLTTGRAARALLLLLVIGLSVIGLIFLYQIPIINEHLFWRVDILRASVRELIAPVPSYVLLPQETLDVNIIASALAPVSAPNPAPSPAAPDVQDAQPIPEQVYLSGTVHQWQHWNNCGPATVAMTLNFWGWQGTQANAAAFLKPNRNDRNVSPDELVSYAQRVGYSALTRVAGTPALMQQLVAAGIPVIIERDLWLEEEGWAGHYALIIGYNRTEGTYRTQDTFQGPELDITEDRLNEIWLPFNYRYVVIFPPDREEAVLNLLGDAADSQLAYQQAADRALRQVRTLTDSRQALAYFNLGTSLQALGDMDAAAAAFDTARVLNIPYRMVWYQPEIFTAYFDLARYSEVISLADFVLNTNAYSEEAFYWRGRAYEALGDIQRALNDYQASVRLNPNFSAAVEALAALEHSS